MSGTTPNIDQLASEGAIFTDYYAEASSTAGRANFITGGLPIRTGMTRAGDAPVPELRRHEVFVLTIDTSPHNQCNVTKYASVLGASKSEIGQRHTFQL